MLKLFKNPRIHVFLEFLIFGFILGAIEDILAVMLATGEPFSWKMLAIVFIVTIPFAAVGEFIVDKSRLITRRKRNKKLYKALEIITEFFVFGMVMSIVEDLLVIVFATGHPITWHVIGISAAVTLPFAIFGEIYVDRIKPKLRRHSKKLAHSK